MLIFEMMWMAPLWLFQEPPMYCISFPTAEMTSTPPTPRVLEERVEQAQRETQETGLFWKFFKKALQKKYERPQKKAWTKDEDATLLQLQSEGMTWNKISQILSISNPDNCRRRFQRLEGVKQKWPPALDSLVKQMVEDKKMKWIDIAKIISSDSRHPNLYTGKMVRERYKNVLRPGIRKQQWKISDDILLLELVLKHGTYWSKLTEKLEGRSELELKNRYHGILEPLRKKATQKAQQHLRGNTRMDEDEAL